MPAVFESVLKISLTGSYAIRVLNIKNMIPSQTADIVYRIIVKLFAKNFSSKLNTGKDSASRVIAQKKINGCEKLSSFFRRR